LTPSASPLSRYARLAMRAITDSDPPEAHLRDLSIVVPVFNGRRVLERALLAFEVAAWDAEVIVVDGGSTDGALEYAVSFARDHPWLRVLEVRNHGWAHATNRGFALALRPLLMSLNSDAFVNRSVLLAMASRLRQTGREGRGQSSIDPAIRVAAVGPSLRNLDGSKQRAFTALYWPNWVAIRKVVNVPVLHGAALMTSRAVLEQIGGFDEVFFLYNEELDWCARARRAGYRLELVPEAMFHVGGGSTGQRDALIELEEHRGFLRFLEKNHGGWPLSIARMLVWFRARLGTLTDSRPEYRLIWRQLEELVRSQNFVVSPFALSGRGEVRFTGSDAIESRAGNIPEILEAGRERFS
jgi:N-acetylglucosaminyl-diphospho-decaprenol L-rhamnosyltransferase